MSVHIDPADAQAVAQAMREFEKRCEAIQDLLGEKRSLSLSEREHIADLYRSLKDDLKTAAKRGTLDEKRRPQTQAESAFYDPAVRKAHIALRPATNSHPITSHWFGAVWEARSEFSYYLHSLESFLGD